MEVINVLDWIAQCTKCKSTITFLDTDMIKEYHEVVSVRGWSTVSFYEEWVICPVCGRKIFSDRSEGKSNKDLSVFVKIKK